MIAWLTRYDESSLEGWPTTTGRVSPSRIDHRAIGAATLRPSPKKLGVSYCSSRLLAGRLGIDHSMGAKAWREYGLESWREGTFTTSTNPNLVATAVDAVGLYLAHRPTRSWKCMDGRSQIQALEHTATGLPMRPRKPAAHTHDYIRSGFNSYGRGVEWCRPGR